MSEITVAAEEGLGNATPDQVMEGATFTSETGFKQTGTLVPLTRGDVVDNFESDATDLPASARTVKVMNESLEKVKIYVGSDGKLHFVDASGADTVLPFNNLNSAAISIAKYQHLTTGTALNIPTVVNGYYLLSLQKNAGTATLSISGVSGCTLISQARANANAICALFKATSSNANIGLSGHDFMTYTVCARLL